MNTAFLRDIAKLNDLAEMVERFLVKRGGQSSNLGRRTLFSFPSSFFFLSLFPFFFLFFLFSFSSFFFFFLSLFLSRFSAGGLLRWCTGRWALPRDRQCVVHFCAPADRCIVLHRRFAYHVPRQPGREPQGRDASTEWASTEWASSTQAARLPGCCGGA